MTTGLHSIDVKVGFGSGPFAATPTYTSIAADVVDITVTRGRTSPLQVWPVATVTITLDNTSRKYDPKNAAGPYFGNLDRRSPVFISANDSTSTTRTIFAGVIAPRGWQAKYPWPHDARTTLILTDLFQFLGNTNLPSLYPAVSFGGELSGARVNRILDLVGIPSALRTIDAGATILQGSQFRQTARQELQTVEDSEGGNLYTLRNGNINFDGRLAVLTKARMLAAQATFSDAGGTDVPMSIVEWGFDDICNDATIGRLGGANFQLVDNTSIVDNGPVSISRTNLQMQNDPEAYARAELLVRAFDTPTWIPTFVELDVIGDGDLALDQALNRELRDRAALKFTPPGGGAQNTADVYIEQIQHQIRVEATPPSWKTQLHFSSGTRFDFVKPTLVLDDATVGRLDTGLLAF